MREERIEEKHALELKSIAQEEGRAVYDIMRDIFERGLRAYKIEKAIKGYLQGSLSQGAAANKAGLTTQELHQELKKRGFFLRIDAKKIELELKEL